MDAADSNSPSALATLTSRWAIPLCALLGLLLGAAIYMVREPVYESHAQVNVNNPIGTMAEEAQFLLSARVIEPSVAALGFQPDVEVTENEIADLLTVTVTGSDAEQVAQAAAVVAQTYVESRTTTAASIAAPAEVPTGQTSPKLGLHLVVGSVLGGLVGLAVAGMRSLRSSLPDRPSEEQRPDPIRPAQDATGLADRIMASRDQHDQHQTSAPEPSGRWSDHTISAPAAPAPEPEPEPVPVPAPEPEPEPEPEPVREPVATAGSSFSNWSGESSTSGDSFINLTEPEPAPQVGEVEALRLEHEHELAELTAKNRKLLSNLRQELTETKRQLRSANTTARRTSGNDQSRIGDLEAQLQAAENEIAGLREQIENQRVEHIRELANERQSADRALDQARREFRRRSAEIKSTARTTSLNDRADLDRLLATTRSEHQAALDEAYQKRDTAVAAERTRRINDIEQLKAAHAEAIEALNQTHTEALETQTNRTKSVIAELRVEAKGSQNQIEELEAATTRLRRELSTTRKSSQTAKTETAKTTQDLRDELAVAKKELQSERDRSAALREDLLRQTARANRQADQELEERTARLAELDELMTSQRELAETRIREAVTAADLRVREAGRREDELSAAVAELKRRLAKHEPVSD